MNLKYMSLVLALLLTSCSNINTYQEPSKGSQSLATVTGSFEREDLTNWYNINVTAIDNKQVSYGWSSDVNVIPGSHMFVVQYEFHRGSIFSGRPNTGVAELRANVRGGMSYRVVGKPEGAYMKLWMVDNSGNRASGVISSNYQPVKLQPVYMPLVVPAS